MAIKFKEETVFGEERDLYVRLNSVETNNHGAKTAALFRGFLSEQAFREGKHYVFEQSVEFDADVSLPLWDQAYSCIKEQRPDAEDC